MRFLKILASIITIFIFIGCSDSTQDGPVQETYKNGDVIELESVLGTKMTLLRKDGGFVLKGNENKILILDFFGTFCRPCQKEAPKLMNFQLKNDKDVVLIGFTSLEDVTNEYVRDNFVSKYNAYYFIVNSPNNEKLLNTVTKDIDYNRAVQVPFKVVLKNGKYQKVTDPYDESPNDNFYIGAIETEIIEKDINRIKSTNE
ncbi:TlpA family protein disulfide reductase [Sulfurospirillum sp. 1307]|jgi:thiol-disulfide isomerase/thioredoxin